ncbi:Protein CFAP20DC [Geodia barretti]|nr:Protein CFAP20DC [Geodia barretti]
MVLSAQGKDPTAHCRQTGSVSLRYDKGVRGYVHVLEGDSITTRIHLPASDRTSLGLEQSFIILQAAVQRDARFTVEFVLQDGKGGRRRINFSSSLKEPSISTLIARVPFVTQATGEDYDWRQYASREDTPLSPSSPHTLLHLPTYHHGNSTTPEPDTSTLSMIDKPAAHSLLDTLDTRGMGGALSPELQDEPVLADRSNQSNGSDEELELMYDPQLRCFFDPQTHKYYELIQ